MNEQEFSRICEVFRTFEAGTLSRLFRFLLVHAEHGSPVFREKGAIGGPLDTAEGPPADSADDPLLSPKQAAKYLGISWQTLKAVWVPRYQIPFTGKGRLIRFRRSDLNKVVSLREREAAHA